MRTLLWAFIERLAPRAGTALLMLVFAASSSPTTVGYYAAAMTGYMVLQSLTDGAAKRVAVSAVATEDGLAFLRRYRKLYGIFGTAFLALLLYIIFLWGAPLGDTLTLLPLLSLPLIMGKTIEPLALLQRSGQWPRISYISATSALLALAMGFPLVLSLNNALGSVSQLVITEGLFALRLHFSARGLMANSPRSQVSTNYRTAFWSTGGFIISMQGQYMLDRLLVGIFGGAGALGVFNLGWSLSRGISDSLSTSTLNVLQAQIMNSEEKTQREIHGLVMRTLPKALLLTSSVVAAVYVLSRYVAPAFLGAEWADMLHAVPLMSLTAIPSVCCYCLLPVLMYYKRMRWAITPRIIGLIFSVAIGWSVQYSLELAVWIALLRESVSMIIMLLGARAIWSYRLILFPIATTLSAGLLVFALDYF